MNHSLKGLLLGACLLLGLQAKAVEYYELEVYGFETAQPHELEVENGTSLSSDDEHRWVNQIFRSTFEFNYGLSDRWEVTAYLDYTQPSGEYFEYTAFRAHARTHFFEKGEMPVDMGAYFEVELPRNYRQEDVGFEFRPIFEKDFSRWTLRVNPQIEVAHAISADADDAGPMANTDDDDDFLNAQTPTTNKAKSWQVSWGAASSLIYNMTDSFRAHLDWHVGLTDGSQLLVPAVDFRVMPGLFWTLGLGFGLNANTEQRLSISRLEYEIYF